MHRIAYSSIHILCSSLVAHIIHRPLRSYSKASCLHDSIDICSDEDEFPAILFLLALNHLLYHLIAVIPAGVLHSVCDYHEQCLLRHILFSCILVDIADMVNRTSKRIKQCCAATHVIVIVRHLWYILNRNPVVQYSAEVVKEHSRNVRLSIITAIFLLLFHH